MDFLVIPKDLILLNKGHPRQYGGSSAGAGPVDEGYQNYEGALGHCQDNSWVVILTPSKGDFNRCRVSHEETMGV